MSMLLFMQSFSPTNGWEVIPTPRTLGTSAVGETFADTTPIVPEADMIPKLKNMTAESFSDIVTEDDHGHSAISKPPCF